MAKNKKLIIIIAVLAVFVAVAVILAAVFSTQEVYFVAHDIDGSLIIDGDAPTADVALEQFGGKSILFLSKESVCNYVNESYPQWHAFCVVKNFPNAMEIHVVRRVAIAKINIGPSYAYVDCFGCVAQAPEPEVDKCVNITSAFENPSLCKSNTVGNKLEFSIPANNEKLQIVIDSLRALWRCYVDYNETSAVIGDSDVFTFNGEGDLVITTRLGAKIQVQSPQSDLEQRLIRAFSVYYSEKINLQQQGIVIKVLSNGKITTNNN